MPQKTQTGEWHIPKDVKAFVPTIPTCFEIVTDAQFEIYHNFFDKSQSVAHEATLHLTNGKEVPVERSKTEISHLTKRLRLFLQDEKVTREVIPRKFLSILGGRFQTSSEATEFQKKQCPCGKLGVKKCSRCHTQYYCDTSCQRKDWSKHKVNCVE